ncbi:hypothetical protein [Paraflavitalea speifideaquila]|uniref:hypothetical protein n=1 Tax=Paraflavitalea speifideaquila TaxID=3076558 RepID=UPI0028F081BD|nr:hypothetical protein [Paraflavitalea speifideiaquila]
MKNNSKSCLQHSMQHERKAKKDRNKCAAYIGRTDLQQLVRDRSMLAGTEALCRTVFGGRWGKAARQGGSGQRGEEVAGWVCSCRLL